MNLTFKFERDDNYVKIPRSLFSELKRLAFRDALTGLYNRNFFEESYKREKERANREKKPFSVIIMDVDNFKMINDTYGHLTGDEVLKSISKIMKKTFRKTDIIARYGGDEFIVFMPNTDENKAEVAVSRFKKNLEALNNEGKFPFRIEVSVGKATQNVGESSKKDPIREADFNMYREKKRKSLFSVQYLSFL